VADDFGIGGGLATQLEGADGAIYSLGDPLSSAQSLLFTLALERDPEVAVRLFREGGMQVVEAAPVTLLGGASLAAWEISGEQAGNAMWVRQLAAPDGGADGRRLVVQYGVFGGGAEVAAQAPFERILASLERLPADSLPVASLAQTAPVEPTAVVSPPAAALTAATGVAPEAAPGAAPGTTDPQSQAAALFEQIRQRDDHDLAGIEALYRQVLESYPQTEQAQESYWRLSNLYLQAYDPPRRADAIALLEQYRQRYPDSTLLDQRFALFSKGFLSLVEERLLQLYEEAESWDKAEAIYVTFLPDAAALTDEKRPFVPARAKVLERLGRPAEAAGWYRLYVERSPDPNDFLVGIARAEMERLDGVAAALAPPAATASAVPVAAGSAPEPPPAERAAALLEEAKQAQVEGKYAEALEKYRGSLALQPDPEVEKRVRKLEAYLKIVGGAPKGQ
jgi:hypothetical protein